MKITQVAAALIWREDKILICRRPANKARALLWEFPGGKVEAGETKEQALVRECRKELGITVVPGSVYYEVTHTYPDITIHLTLFNCTTQNEPQRLEHSELAWILPQNVTAYDFCPADKAIVAKIAAQANAKIQTERLYLRELTPSDEAELKTFLQDKEVMYAWEAPFTDAEVAAWLTENLRRYKEDGFSFYAVIEKCSDKFLGVCGPLIETINGERRMGVAYIFNKTCWGKGYATEAAQASVNHAFGALGAEEVIAEIRPENKKSRRVAERLGMAISGSFVKTYKGKEMPHLIYILKKPQKSRKKAAETEQAMFDLDRWLDKYIEAVDAAFGARIVFIGLQGSYARGEAHEGSDIDVVLILNSLTLDDLTIYKSAIANLEERTKICGFISGTEELKAWDKADLFQFCRDTKALYGDLEFIAFLTGEADAKRALHTAACNIYHACVHNFVHEESAEVLKMLYKSAFFALQAKYYLETGAYIAKRKDLANKLQGEDLKILTCPAQLKTKISTTEFSAYSGLLLNWAAAVIKNYGGGSNAETEN